MRIEPVSFGTAERFQVTLNWADDHSPAAQRPSSYGWSMGHLRIAISGISLTASRMGDQRQTHVGWYLGPMFRWLTDHWIQLLHEERFDWPTKDSAPAAMACRRALALWAGLEDETGVRNYRLAQAWYHRHGLRSAAAGGLFPDLFVRRVADDVELSWTGTAPPFAPEGLSFESGAGVARLAVADVAGPLWQMLLWIAQNPPPLLPEFREDWEALCARIDEIAHLGVEAMEATAITDALLTRAMASFAQVGRTDLIVGAAAPQGPFLDAMPPAVAMFGGVTPDLSDGDIAALRDSLVASSGGADNALLADLVADRHVLPVGRVPYKDGYRFAQDLLDDLEEGVGDISTRGFVDIRELCRQFGIEIKERTFDTAGIRGVALAGEGFGPSILLNLASPFNLSEDGKRFTIAHELCHILYDRSRARRVAHSSGPWAAPGIEKRANAFAAYLLMPPVLLHDGPSGRTISFGEIRTRAKEMRVGESALIEHLYNRDVIDEAERETLRLSAMSGRRRGSPERTAS